MFQLYFQLRPSRHLNKCIVGDCKKYCLFGSTTILDRVQCSDKKLDSFTAAKFNYTRALSCNSKGQYFGNMC